MSYWVSVVIRLTIWLWRQIFVRDVDVWFIKVFMAGVFVVVWPCWIIVYLVVVRFAWT